MNGDSGIIKTDGGYTVNGNGGSDGYDDYEKIADLELYLDEIPDYLALKLTTEYQSLKAKLRAREA